MPVFPASLRQIILIGIITVANTSAEVTDVLTFGNTDSETAHDLVAKGSRITHGTSAIPVRQFITPDTPHWRGGSLTFKMKVDADKPNYFTAAFWGGDLTGEHSRLMLFIDGKQIGQRHLGEVDMLDTMYDYPRYPGGFVLKTLPLPAHMTKGRDTVELSIEHQGSIWGYGDTPERYQKVIKKDSRGIYTAYTHTQPYLIPPGGRDVADPPQELPTRKGYGPEVMDEIKTVLNQSIDKLIKNKRPNDQRATQFLARACTEPWCTAYQNKAALEKIVEALDHHYLEFAKDPEIPQKTWEGYGPLADAVRMLARPLSHYSGEKVTGSDELRRDAWAKMFAASRDWHVTRRRIYTNQSMIVDSNTYACNRALTALKSNSAWPEEKALQLLHEACGIKPWSGNWDTQGNPTWTAGKSHMLFTDQGLTKELGYVGHYGEIVVGIMLDCYELTRPSKNRPGDFKLGRQLVKITRARSIFRYPMPDTDGNRSMQVETVVGWRDWYYPGGVTYEQMHTEAPLQVAAVTLDPVLVGAGQQMLEDNHYFSSLKKRLTLRGWHPKMRLLTAPSDYETILKQAPRKERLPMTWNQPDFVFTDPEIGLVALKNKHEILYCSLYWRARYAINNLARVHHITAKVKRDATIRTETRFDDSGFTYTIPDLTNTPFSKRMEGFYKAEGMYLAMAGQQQPIAKVPSSVKDWKPGKENPYAGKGKFYLMPYGPYLIAMNCTRNESFTFDIPTEYQSAKDLVTGRTITAKTLTTRPFQTIVLYQEKK